ncbi:MAG TPA: hypothetical protein VHF67_05690 [Gaiellaceae bacterium]|nr:hypothetical protein [Gaiellaceae bacterium]
MSSDAFDAFPDAEELLGGLPARRANTLLFLIESRTARLIAESRQAAERLLTEEAAEERELAFVEAFALARDPPIRPTIQDLERYSRQWASLVPDNPRVQATLARRLGEKYEFTRDAVPRMRAALGLDDPAVEEAYARLYREPLETIYAARARRRERLRFRWAALAGGLEDLPPFWTAYALTLTETVGASILALPIALAAVGPLAGAAVLVVFGLVNVLTVAFMAEAVARSGTIRYGGGFFGRLVADYLGRGGSLFLSASLFTICFLILPAYYIGFSTTLADATSVPASAFVVLLFLAGLYYLRRESLNATIATALVVGAVNIGLLGALSLLAFAHVRPSNLLHTEIPFVGGRAFEPALLGLIFGVILAAYFGHMSVAICGRLVLRRDPTGRSLTWGCAAAQATAMVLYCLFVLSVNGAIAPERLARESGTALGPLARELGPAVHVLGSAFVILGMGMASITFSLALFNITRERLPSRSQRLFTLPRRRARLLFRERGQSGSDRLQIGVIYLGLEGGNPRLRFDVERGGRIQRVEAVAAGQLELTGADAASAVVERLPDLRGERARLVLEIADVDEEDVVLGVTTTLTVEYVVGWDPTGLRLGDILALPDSQAELLAWMMRRGDVSAAEAAAHTGQEEGTTRAVLESLVQEGIVGETTIGREPRYSARVGARTESLSPHLWQAVTDGEDALPAERLRGTPSLDVRQRLQAIALGPRGRFAVGASPVLAAFALAEWMLLTGSGSFAGLLSFVGVIVVSILAGIFPVLLLVVSRRKGEYAPRFAYRFLGNPVLLAAIYALFLASILVHGLVIWDGILERAGALAVGVLILGMTIVMGARGALARRLTVELRDDESEGRARFAVSAGGEPVWSDVRLAYPDGEQRLEGPGGYLSRFASLLSATFHPVWDGPRARIGRELKVWVHRVTRDGDSEPLAGRVQVESAGVRKEFDLGLARGQVRVQLSDSDCRVAITLSEAPGP